MDVGYHKTIDVRRKVNYPMQSKSFHIFEVREADQVQAIEAAVRALDGVRFITGDPKTKIFAVQWAAPATFDDIVQTITGLGYRPATK